MTRAVLLAHAGAGVRRQLRRLLTRHGCTVLETRDRAGLLQHLQRARLRLVLLDLRLPGGVVLDTLLMLRDRDPGLPVVVLSRADDQPAAAQALLLGAADALRLPVDPHEAAGRLGRLLDGSILEQQVDYLRRAAAESPTRRHLVSRSPAMQRAVALLDRIAPSRSTVLLLGESGVGKELFARAIHFHSPRRQAPWVVLNCSAIPDSLIESELFGHEKGAFTGAVERTRGKFEQAHTGTIFLDEIGEMNPGAQAKLLRVLEEREVIRVGGSRPIHVDVRLLAATNSDLEARIRQGTFREDLYYRLNVITVRIPALRERREDLPVLVERFLEESVRANAAPSRRIHPEARAILEAYSWPGNVRELKNLMENLVLMTPGPEITPDDLPERIRRVADRPDSHDGVLRPGVSLRAAEQELIRRTLEHVDGNRLQAAAMLGIGVRTLQRKIGRYGLRQVRAAR